MTGVEYRVAWRRAAWRDGKWKTRLFADREAAERFIARRLHGRDRPELSPVQVKLTWREVGPWRDDTRSDGGA